MEGKKTTAKAGHRFMQASGVDAVTEDFQRLQDSLCTEFPEIAKVTCDFKDLKATCSALIGQNRDVIARLLLLHTTVKTSESALEVLQLKGSNMTLTETLERYSELIVKLSCENEYYVKHLTTLLGQTEGKPGELLLLDREEELRMLREQLRTRGRSVLLEKNGLEISEQRRADLRAVEELFGRQETTQAALRWKELDYASLPGVPTERTISLLKEVLRLKDTQPSHPMQRTKSHNMVKSLKAFPFDRERNSDASKSTAIPSSSPSMPRMQKTEARDRSERDLAGQVERLETELALYKGKSRHKDISVELALRDFAGKIGGRNIENHLKEAVSKVEKSALSALSAQITATAEGKFTLCNSQLQMAQAKIKSLETAIRLLEGDKAQASLPLDSQQPRPATYSFSQTSESNPFDTKRTVSPLTKRTDKSEQGGMQKEARDQVRSREKGIEEESAEVLTNLKREKQDLLETFEKQREKEVKLRGEIASLKQEGEERLRLCASLRGELALCKQELSQALAPAAGSRSTDRSQTATNQLQDLRKSQELDRELVLTKQRASDLGEELGKATNRCKAAEENVNALKQTLVGLTQHFQEALGLPKTEAISEDPAAYLKLAETVKATVTQFKSAPQQVLNRFESALQRCQDLAVSLGRMNESAQGRLLQENLELERRVASQDLPTELPKAGEELTRWVIAKWQDAEEALVKAKSASESHKHTINIKPTAEKDSQIEALKQTIAQAYKQLSSHKQHHRSNSHQLKSLQTDLQSAEILKLEQEQVIARLQAEVEHYQRQLKRTSTEAENKEVALIQSLSKLKDTIRDSLGGSRTLLDPYENPVGFVDCLSGWLQEINKRRGRSERAERDLQAARENWMQRESDLLSEIRLLSQEKAFLEVSLKSSPPQSVIPTSPKLSLTLPTQESSDTLKRYYSQ